MTSPLPFSTGGFPPFMPSPIFSTSFGHSIVSPPPHLPSLPQPLNFSNGLKFEPKSTLETKFEPNLSAQHQMMKLEQAHQQQQREREREQREREHEREREQQQREFEQQQRERELLQQQEQKQQQQQRELELRELREQHEQVNKHFMGAPLALQSSHRSPSPPPNNPPNMD